MVYLIGSIVSINISKGGIPKLPVSCIAVTEQGLSGDGHNHQKHYRLNQAVSLQDIEMLEQLKMQGYALYPGATGENFTVKNILVNNLSVGTILEISSGVNLEITKIRMPCYVLDSINPKLKEDIVNRCGVYAKVVRPGIVHQSDQIIAFKPADLFVQ